MDIRKLGLRIKNQREKKKLRQSDIAHALQISSQAVSKWERGENAPDISILIDLAQLLGVNLEWLLGGTIPENDTFCATIFCSDLSGFAKKSATMSPRDLAIWANSIYYTVTEAVIQFDGIPVKYVGDGFLGFFTGLNHSKRALKAARKARELLNNPDLNIGLHRGEIFLGTLGHPDYSTTDIIGETVNTAFLAMGWISKNCINRIGITEEVYKNLSNKENLKKLEEINIMGVDQLVVIYEAI